MSALLSFGLDAARAVDPARYALSGAAPRAALRPATREEVSEAARAGTYLSPQVGLVVQNYLENKARYIGVGSYSEAGMAIMERDLPLDFEVCRFAVAAPGAKVVFSTDATAGAHGRNAEEFLGRIAHCGQTPMQALVSANALAAESMGLGDRIGRLEPGYEADIIAVDGDPLTDPTAVRRVVFVMRGGVVYKWAGPKSPGAHGSSVIPAGRKSGRASPPASS